MAELGGKTVLITGGAGSIGMALALRCLTEDAEVMLVDCSEARIDAAQAALTSGAASFAVADVGDPDEVKAVIAQALGRWPAIDAIVAGAGNLGPIVPIADYNDTAFDEVLRVHVKGAFLICKYGLPAMRDGGSIVITSSVAGLRGDAGPYGYIAAKHAQVGLMRALAKEAAPRGIRVNSIHPGPIANDFQAEVERRLTPLVGEDGAAFFDRQIPLGRHGRPEEIADAILFLISDCSSFMTGSRLAVDGGMSS